MKLSDEQAQFAFDVSRLIQYVFENEYTCTLGEVYRTPAQARIYAEQNKGVPNSLHCKRLAVDINLFKDGEYLTDSKDYEIFGKYWEELNDENRWGGYFASKYGGHLVDGNHFERFLG